MVVVLAVIAMVSAAILTQVYEKTSVIIEENAARALEDSVFEVLPGTADVNIIRSSPRPPARRRSQGNAGARTAHHLDLSRRGRTGCGNGLCLCGGEGNGYGGAVRVLVGGVDEVTDAILNIKILAHTETPGLGDRIESENFRSQFVGRELTDPIKLNQDIDSIAGGPQFPAAR